MPEESDSRKDSHPTKLKQRSKVLIKLSFTVLCDSKFSGLQNFDNSHFIKSKKKLTMGKVSCEFMDHKLEITFVTFTETFVVTNDTQGPREYSHHWKWM